MRKNLSYFAVAIFFFSLLIVPKITAAEEMPSVSPADRQIFIDGPIQIQIGGDNFGDTQGQVINLTTNAILNLRAVNNERLIWTDTELLIFYPYVAPPNTFRIGENRLVVKTATGSESAPFIVTGKKRGVATISSVTPTSIHLNEEVLINGSGFGANGLAPGQEVGILKDYLDTKDNKQQVVSWSDTQIRIRLSNVPVGYSGNVNISVWARAADTGPAFSNLFPIYVDSSPLQCTSWTYSEWGSCSANGQQTRLVVSSSPNGCAGGNPVLSQSCAYVVPTCTSWTYSNWSGCSPAGQQTRSILSSIPVGCTDGNPVLQQSCTPPCSADTWSCGDWNACSTSGTQTRSCTKNFDCPTAETPSPITSQNCAPPQSACNADTWTCGGWDTCSLSGIQNRSCSKTFDCPSVETAPPTTAQYCEAPNRPTQQAPQDSSEEISNQDTIIKSTVKLLCPVDMKRASQGSGTIIDPSGTILTNKHVIAGTLGCLVGFINEFSDEPYFGDRQIADIVKVSSSQDLAILKIKNPRNVRLTSIDIKRGNGNPRLGTKVTTYGYPAKFGTKLTYTSGDFSGTDGSYIKTTAILEYGNSGGGAYLKDGTFIGVPSAVVKGELNALGYILSIGAINAWLGNSSLTLDRGSNNQYSRVSVLEDLDLNKLDSLKLFIPDTDVSGALAAPVAPIITSKEPKVIDQPSTNQKEQGVAEQQQTQEESTIIESSGTEQEINTPEQDKADQERKQNPRASWWRRFFLWFVNLF